MGSQLTMVDDVKPSLAKRRGLGRSDLTVDCSQSPIFQWDRRDRALWSPTPAPSVHLKIKMAAINGKTRYIKTISRKNRGLSTVYALLNSSPLDPLPTVAHGCSGPIANITKWYNKFKQNRLNAQTPQHNVSLLLLCVFFKKAYETGTSTNLFFNI